MVWCNAYSEMSGYETVYKNSSSAVIKNSTDANGSECDSAVPDWSANGYSLPTEGEWQYAASYQDGTTFTPYNYASGTTADYNDATACNTVAWYSANSGGTTHNVGTRETNQLGIADMSGNVLEWCWDWHENNTTTEKTDYKGAASGSSRIIRGGGYGSGAERLQVGYRNIGNPNLELSAFGFRLVRR